MKQSILTILVMCLMIITSFVAGVIIKNSDFMVARLTRPTMENSFVAYTPSTVVQAPQTVVQAPQTVVQAPQTPLAYKFGLSLGETPYGLSDAQLNIEFNDIASLGAGWVRFDIPWNIIQASNVTIFNWNGTDRIVAAANAHGIKLLPILTYTPAWARLPECKLDTKCMPADPTAFAVFAQQAVQRYAQKGVHTWEIWNEPNIPQFWLPAPNTASYAALLKASYTAIKAIDPSAIVITGGLSPATTIRSDISPTDFLAGLYKQGMSGYFDAVGMHPYSFPVMPSYSQSWNAWSQMSLTSLSLRNIMTANGDSGKAIWMTEFGAPTGGPGVMATVGNYQIGNSPDHVDEALQSDIIADAVKLAQTYPWAGPLFIYSYKDQGILPYTIENFFGLLRYDGTAKPSYDMFKKLLNPAPILSAPAPAPITIVPVQPGTSTSPSIIPQNPVASPTAPTAPTTPSNIQKSPRIYNRESGRPRRHGD